MPTKEVEGGARLPAGTRYESLVRASNAIGTHRDPQDLFSALVRELHTVVRFDYIGVSIRDENSNTFHRHFVDAEQKQLSLQTRNCPWRNPMLGGYTRSKSPWLLHSRWTILRFVNSKRF
jgi:hypothetical protein